MKSSLLAFIPLVVALSLRAAGEPSFPITGVTFSTSDAKLQALYDAAESKEAQNVRQFTPFMKILVEGAQYSNCWIETQPMGGEMYAQRDVSVALNNQVIFLLTQRADGRFPGMVRHDKPEQMAVPPIPGHKPAAGDFICWFKSLQGFCFADPAWRMYFWAGKDKAYLQQLYNGLAAYDAYLWRTRDSNGDGVLETWCTTDTGEDNSTRYHTRGAPVVWPFDTPPGSPGTPDPSDPQVFKKYWVEQVRMGINSLVRDQVLVPFDSMDIMGYSCDARETLAKISHELNNGKEAEWQKKAEEVRTKLAATLWNPDRHACFDHDKNGKALDEVVHNNLRAMYHGAFSQQMADEFINYHLLNSAEFWTPVPLPSIAINSSLFLNSPRPDWSGQPQGLTYQRAIRALENYGHYSLVTELGQKLIDTIESAGNKFTEQYDTFTGAPSLPKLDGYGPTILAALEYISRMNGVHFDPVASRVWWSACDNKEFTYSERWGDTNWTLTSSQGEITGSRNGSEVFRCTAGVRIVTDLTGSVIALVGIAQVPQKVRVQVGASHHEMTVVPDQVVKIDTSMPTGFVSRPLE
jgi:hypothetical protein